MTKVETTKTIEQIVKCRYGKSADLFVTHYEYAVFRAEQEKYWLLNIIF